MLDHARYCHQCGSKVAAANVTCPSCQSENPANATFCSQCGQVLGGGQRAQQQQGAPNTGSRPASYKFDFSNIKFIVNDIRQYFFAALQRQLADEQNPKKYPDYLDVFYNCPFRGNFEKRAAQLAEELQDLNKRRGPQAQAEIDRLMDRTFDALLDHFILVYCKHLNELQLPEAILKYATAKAGEFPTAQIIFDYLDLNHETEATYYLDFVTMPAIKLKNAVKSFLFNAGKEENPLLICDQTIFGSCKEGFCLTDRGIYWKAHFNKPGFARYAQLEEVVRQSDWISINGQYFHVSKGMNVKILKLLKKLKTLYSTK